ncbi:hypothetical protein HNQ51_002183 [Inhella inkyongensis]|uniref:Uncharacterized protein n=1 Tax=Inhella inkyongensis TaxID=392593 RepID=A0A840S8X7_9BURK|nr:hypothetical protein [Inhella inkyongensis]MBB5204869.1 hypothetical protein [Inhella inkyongensis]
MSESVSITTLDRSGRSVGVGSFVRVLTIDPEVFVNTEREEVPRIQSMLGEVLEVYEVDQWGRAWVEKWWHEGEGQSTSHSLALDPQDMELVR